MDFQRIFWWLLAAVGLLLTYIHGEMEGDLFHFKPCPENYTRTGGKCYGIMDGKFAFWDAYEMCEGHLPIIMDNEENLALRDAVGSEEVWLALYGAESHYGYGMEYIWISDARNESLRPYRFNPMRHVYSRSGYRCVTQFKGGDWVPEDCSNNHTSVCVRSVDCAEGWYGANCSKACHCFNYTCGNRTQERCPSGCRRGWKGEQCDIAQDEGIVSATYYCFKGQSNYSALIYLDPKDFRFQAVNIIDDEDKSVCDKDTFTHVSYTEKLHLRIDTDGESVFRPSCPAKKLDDSPTLQWTIRFSKVSGVDTVYDEDIIITCNFSAADSLTIDNKEIATKESSSVSIPQSRISASIYLVTASTMTPLGSSAVSPGVTLHLMVTPPKATGTRIKYLYPVRCQAQSPDGKMVKNLTDSRGCSISETGFGMLEKRDTDAGPIYMSQPFTAFGFPSYDSVEFKCDFIPDIMVGSTCR